MTPLVVLLASFVAPADGLDHVPGSAIRGPLGESGGFGVRAAGDVNADGFDDLLTYAVGPGLDSFVRVVSGADGRVLHEFPAIQSSGVMRTPFGGVGDVDLDGFDDVVVGDGGRDVAYVYSGADGSVIHLFQGAAADDGFGGAAAGAGDVDADGVPDVIVGTARIFATADGYARVYSGATGSLLFEFRGRRPKRSFGGAVAAAGDVDGDGHGDLVIGCLEDGNEFLDPGNPAFGIPPFRDNDEAGCVYVYSGRDGRQLYRFVGDDPYDGLGFSVAGGSDVDGDGVDDVVAGTVGEFPAVGYARVYSGATGQVLHTFLGPSQAPISGEFVLVDLAGDVDRDGRADVIVSAYLTGGNQPDVFLYSGASGAELLALELHTIVDFTIAPVGRAGDLNGDGIDDFAFGVARVSSTLGFAQTYLSVPGPGTTYCSSVANSTGEAARASTGGSASVAANDLCLVAESMPPGVGSFVYGSARASSPFGSGTVCVGGAFARLPAVATVNGVLSQRLDLLAPPTSASTITAGSTWNFQAWCTDGADTALSDAVEVVFDP